MRKNNKKITLTALVLFALLSVVLYQRLSIKNVPSATQAAPVAKPTPSKVLPNSPTKAPSTPSSKQTSSRSAAPQIKKTEQPKIFPTSTKSSAKPVTPVKYGNTIPINDIYPFPVVGKQIDAGYYFNNQGGCDIGVYDSNGRELFEENTHIGVQSIIYLKAGEQIQNLCVLTKGLPPIYNGSNIPTGMHIINGDLKPGTYTTGNNCFYWITKGNSAADYTRGITANNDQRYSSTAGVPFILSDINEAVFFHSGCGVINKVG
jgi:hypothetical protein